MKGDHDLAAEVGTRASLGSPAGGSVQNPETLIRLREISAPAPGVERALRRAAPRAAAPPLCAAGLVPPPTARVRDLATASRR